MTEICIWPSCAHTAKGQCQPDKPITVPDQAPGLYAEITRLKEEVKRLTAGNEDMRHTIEQWQPNMDALKAELEETTDV
jgi:hypothetical protein